MSQQVLILASKTSNKESKVSCTIQGVLVGDNELLNLRQNFAPELSKELPNAILNATSPFMCEVDLSLKRRTDVQNYQETQFVRESYELRIDRIIKATPFEWPKPAK